MPDTNTRQAKRAPVTLKIKFKSATLDQFIERYSVDISHGGIFIRTKDPLPVGTALRFEFQLKDASPLITGEGTVVWTREHDPARAGVAPGMGVRFDRLPPDSQQVLDKILERKSQRTPRSDTSAFVETPTKVAPSPLVNGLAKESRPEKTLVGPAPRASDDRSPTSPFEDLDDVPEEAFEEATKVAHLQALANQSAEPDTIDEAISEMDQDEPTRRVSLEEIERATGEQLPATEKSLEPPSMEDELAARRNAKTEADDIPPAHEQEDADVTDEPEKNKPAAIEPTKKIPTSSKTMLSHNPPPATASPVSTSAPRPSKPSSPPPKAARATAAPEAKVARAADIAAKDRGGSSVPWILAAAVILAAGGVAGWWYLSKDKNEGATASADNTASSSNNPDTAENGTAQDTPETSDDPPEANNTQPVAPPEPKGTLEATVESKTPGANAQLVDGDQQGALPITFKELEDKPYKVVVTADGFLSKEIEIKPGADEPMSVDLEPMPKLVRVNSTPEGADLYINGRKAGTTPHDVELTGPLARKKQLDIRLSKSGYDRFTQRVVVAQASFEPDGDKLVHDLSATLSKRVVQVRRPRPKPKDREPGDTEPDETEPDDTPPTDTPPKDKPPKDKPPKDTTPKGKPPKDKPPKDTPPKDKPKPDEPVPDFMKE